MWRPTGGSRAASARGRTARASAVATSPCTMWPRNVGISTPSTISVGAERGLVNCPAMRPTFTTGSIDPYVSTAAIWSMILSFSRIETAEKSSNDSAQSPAWSRKPRPAATCRQRALAADALRRRTPAAGTSSAGRPPPGRQTRPATAADAGLDDRARRTVTSLWGLQPWRISLPRQAEKALRTRPTGLGTIRGR